MVADLRLLDVLVLTAGHEEGALECYVGLREVPRNEKHGVDQAEEEQDRPNTGNLEVFSRMLEIPRLEASDPTQGGNDDRPAECFSGRAVPVEVVAVGDPVKKYKEYAVVEVTVIIGRSPDVMFEKIIGKLLIQNKPL